MDTELVMWLARIEAKLDLLLAGMAGGQKLGRQVEGEKTATFEDETGGGADPKGKKTDREIRAALEAMTPKQHAVLQMLVRGASTREIAERMGITDNTAKVHVRLIARHLGITRRAEISYRVSPVIESIRNNDYLHLTGGVPKDWDATYPTSMTAGVAALLKPRGSE